MVKQVSAPVETHPLRRPKSTRVRARGEVSAGLTSCHCFAPTSRYVGHSRDREARDHRDREDRDGVAVGIDVAKEFHWVAISSERSEVLIIVASRTSRPSFRRWSRNSRRCASNTAGCGLASTSSGASRACSRRCCSRGGSSSTSRAWPSTGPAKGATGGEHESDARDAVIADQIRQPATWVQPSRSRTSTPSSGCLSAAGGRLVAEQTRARQPLARPPGLGPPGSARRRFRPARLRSRCFSAMSPQRRSGERGGVGRSSTSPGPATSRAATPRSSTDRALGSAQAEQLAAPGQRVAARLVRELAVEAERTRERLAELDAELEAALGRHPDAAHIGSLPGVGTTLTAEFIAEAGSIELFRGADRLPAACGLAPVLKQAGLLRHLKRASAATRRSSGSSSSPPCACSPTPPARRSTPATTRAKDSPPSCHPARTSHASTGSMPCSEAASPIGRLSLCPLDKRIRQPSAADSASTGVSATGPTRARRRRAPAWLAGDKLRSGAAVRQHPSATSSSSRAGSGAPTQAQAPG
jgi:hypothetical protein